MANVQKTVIKATVAVAEVTNELFQKKSSATIIRKLTDSIALMGHATYELSLHRRDLMRPSINNELRSLCNQQIPVTDQLFGNDVQNSLKTIKECNKIANNCTQAQGSEHKRYNNGYKPFLGHRKDHGYKYNKKKPWYNKFFVVAIDKAQSLIGLQTCQDLELISINNNVRAVIAKETEILNEYQDVIAGLSLVDGEFHMELRDAAKPTIHPRRKIPLILMPKLQKTEM